jgi:type VI secretion system secreted protein VgrG
MRDDQPMPITLAIADCQAELHVISFSGLDALNEVFRFDIDLISPDPLLDAASWSGREAFLCLGPPDHCIHGRVFHARQHYAGTCLSHYRLSLMPCLQNLAQRRQRRVHQDLAAPELIGALLREHGIAPGAYRFDRTVGTYPRQPTRIQYDETDLHFLQRVCEEEGIHFRFEHSRNRHLLVFADDPASFTEHSPPLRFNAAGCFSDSAPDSTRSQTPALHHLAERWRAPPVRLTPLLPVRHATTDLTAAPRSADQGRAANQPLDEPAGHAAQGDGMIERQRSVRELERLRCERRGFQGRSDDTGLRSGLVMPVLGHPEPLFNDHWLLTSVRHWARQLDVLEGYDPHDIAAVVNSSRADADLPSAVTPGHSQEQDRKRKYGNSFHALPWAMPYRPPLKRIRPRITGEQTATVVQLERDEQGRLPIRFDWQSTPSASHGQLPSLPMAHMFRANDKPLDGLRPGARVVVAHLDCDLDHPVICGLQPEVENGTEAQLYLDGQRIDNPQSSLELSAGQHLHMESGQALVLRGDRATLALAAQRISINGPRTVHASPLTDVMQNDLDPSSARPDLRLTREPGPQGGPLAYCTWYIVRMPQPGLEHLPRLNPEAILFEGTTDALGYLGLSARQREQLAVLYNRSADGRAADSQAGANRADHQLCLVYPGHCLTLHAWFQQNWTERQRQAFMLSGL